ncbi:hypothetical protein AVEN_135102-1 [Araneus ventricosus]|uniref:Uncharacterized protein n=1 Tax=Araneus ventricosus TaxID=182803 RepID=A0A4Y2JM11_ARAVE|nr:hypothetical protein AVEN_135102-1 [Araneus ventricosus]
MQENGFARTNMSTQRSSAPMLILHLTVAFWKSVPCVSNMRASTLGISLELSTCAASDACISDSNSSNLLLSSVNLPLHSLGFQIQQLHLKRSSINSKWLNVDLIHFHLCSEICYERESTFCLF